MPPLRSSAEPAVRSPPALGPSFVGIPSSVEHRGARQYVVWTNVRCASAARTMRHSLSVRATSGPRAPGTSTSAHSPTNISQPRWLRLPAHSQARCQPRRGAVAGIHARHHPVQAQAAPLVERKVQHRGAGLGCVPLPRDVRVEGVTNLPHGVVGRRKNSVTSPTRSSARSQLRAQRQRLAFSGDLSAAQLAGQPIRQNLLVHRRKRQEAAHVRATAVGQQLLDVLETEGPKPPARKGPDRIRRPQLHELTVPTSGRREPCILTTSMVISRVVSCCSWIGIARLRARPAGDPLTQMRSSPRKRVVGSGASVGAAGRNRVCVVLAGAAAITALVPSGAAPRACGRRWHRCSRHAFRRGRLRRYGSRGR